MQTRRIWVVCCALLMGLPSVTVAQQALFLVRHAELLGQPMAQPKDLPLSDVGQARAEKLASLLKDASISAIYTTEYLRTRKTAEPLAQALKVDITVIPKGGPESLVDRIRSQNRKDTVLIVGHSDTLPGLLKALGHAAEIKIAPQDFGNLFVVVPKGDGVPTFLRLRY